MRVGLALPQFDYSVAGHTPLPWSTLADYAIGAEAAGYDSLWLCDHLFLGLDKYGGPAGPFAGFEPIATLGALARVTWRARLGTLVVCEALRPASVLAKAFASLDVISDGRIDIGLGAGWYEPEYHAIGMDLPPPGVRLARLRDALTVMRGLVGGGPFTYDGVYHRAHDAVNQPAARQRPAPPIIVGGKGDRLLRLVAELADGWNTCWVWTPDQYAERVDVLDTRLRRRRPRPRRPCRVRWACTRCAGRTRRISRVASRSWSRRRRRECSTA